MTLTYSEPIEPRFSIVSVTDVNGHQVTSGAPAREPGSPQTLVVPLEKIPPGWYLVLWRVISADGHPVRGAFTFAVGPSPGPAPQFVIPSLSETAATPGLVGWRFVTFVAMMLAIGLFAFRMLIARPVLRSVPGTSLRPVSTAFIVALAVSLVSVPIYLIVSTAKFALQSWYDLGTLIPLVRASSFGRSFLDLWILLALFGVASLVAIAIDRPTRSVRSVAELLATASGLIAAGAVLEIPGIAGHAAQTSPAALALGLDWVHLVSGSLWIGGLAGLLVLWFSTPPGRRRATLALVVPRFSKVAFVSVMALLASGVVASYLHLPTFASLWNTSYGKTILVKAALLAVAMLFGAVNLLVTRPRLAAAGIRPDLAEGAPRLLRRTVATEVVLVVSAVLAASVLTSLPPPPKALASLGSVSAHVGPGSVSRVVRSGPYTVARAGRTEPRRVAEHLLGGDRAWREARARRRGDNALHDARHGHAAAGLHASRARTRHLLALGACARDGRPLGARIHGHPEGRRPVRRPARGSGERMSDVGLRLSAALLALACAIGAVLVVALLLQSTFG